MSEAKHQYDSPLLFDNPSSTHHIQIEMVPEGSFVLDAGCHTGLLGEGLLSRKKATVVGVDLDKSAVEVAKKKLADAFYLDLEEDDWLQKIHARGHTAFDVIIFGDILEHTKNPDAILRQAHDLVKPGGRIIVSIPNVAHWRVRFGLLLGRFQYQDSGILDRTHLRFYTRSTGRTLLEECGYRIISEQVAGYHLPHWILRTFPGLLGVQNVFAAISNKQ